VEQGKEWRSGVNDKDSLGDRMKGYEDAYRIVLPGRLPLVVRVDGKAFHAYHFEKPFDTNVEDAMDCAMASLCNEIQGAVFAYTQSDEISVFVWPWWRYESQAYFGNTLQKIVSVCASTATVAFNGYCNDNDELMDIVCGECRFDARAFVLPRDEVVNYFIWRQKDWERNSLQMLCRSHFSHKDLLGKGREAMHEMLHGIGVNWKELPMHQRRGRAWRDGQVFRDIPIFTQDRDFIESVLTPKPEAERP
jgi:tRNA(His) guanylyltransferase